MAKPLTTASISAPGFFGLNTQESSVTLAAGFATQADNCIIDKYGRLGARKGYQLISGSLDGVEDDNVGINLTGGHDFIDIDGTHYHGVWSDTSFYITDGSALTEVTYSGNNTITTDGWQAATLNDYAVLFNRDYEPIYFNPSSGTLADVSSVGKGTPPNGNTVLSAYGRIWVADTTTNKNTVYWSSLLDGTDWQTSNGSIDLTSILVHGNDDIVALGAHNGRLIVFCTNNIVIFSDTDADQVLDPTSMRLVEVISGVGCIARDSVQNTGNDIVFLSRDGLRSLGRTLQEKSQPLRDLSKNVRDDLVRDVIGMDASTIRSAYYPEEAMYLLLLPEYQRIYCFDMKMPLQDGSARVTMWDNQVHSNIIVIDHELYFTGADGIYKYYGYTDDGEGYTLKYYTNNIDFDDSTRMKYVKRLAITLIGGSGQSMSLKLGYDYSSSFESYPISIASQANAEYGVAEYGIAEYTVGTLVDTVRAPAGGGGNVIQAGFEAEINGAQLSVQRLDIYTKQGRVY